MLQKKHLAMTLSLICYAFSQLIYYFNSFDNYDLLKNWNIQFYILSIITLFFSVLIIKFGKNRLFPIQTILYSISLFPIFQKDLVFLIGARFLIEIAFVFPHILSELLMAFAIIAIILFPRPLVLWEMEVPFIPLLDYIVAFSSLFLFSIMVEIMFRIYDKESEDKWLLFSRNKAIVRLTNVNIRYQNYVTEYAERKLSEERKEISTSLHNSIGYTLTTIIILLQNAIDISDKNNTNLNSILRDAHTMGKEGLATVRSQLHEYYALGRHYAPTIINYIHDLTSRFSKATGLRIDTHWGNIEEGQLNDSINEFVINFIQEGMTNSFNHGRATSIDIFFWVLSTQSLEVILHDDGIGCDKVSPNVGFNGLTTQAKRINATFSFQNEKNGFKIKALIPLGP